YGLALNMTAPDSMGFLSGSTLDVAYINGRDGGAVAGQSVQNFYVGASIPVPVDKLSAGVAWDARKAGGSGNTDSVLGVYLEYAASEKLTLNLRGERVNDGPALAIGGNDSDAWDVTLTANYALWDGVSTRLEYRMTNLDTPGAANRTSNSLFANVIYEF
ncbi:MAG: outer membrane beta-barrel protein, partial [Verrucomicrobiota bacterium]|nr:outer membrane beta-barrel protein [Verrucomicrobiota bacterium]